MSKESRFILLVCPFCGGSDLRTHGGKDDCFIQCYGCTTTGPNSDNWEAAIERWNRRPVKTEFVAAPAKLKMLPCLGPGCTNKFLTTAEYRICSECDDKALQKLQMESQE